MNNQVQTLISFLLLPLMLFGIARSVSAQEKPAIQTIQQAFEKDQIDRSTKILYQLYAGMKPNQLPAAYQSSLSKKGAIKCATPFVMEFHQHRHQFSPEAQQNILTMTGAANRQTNQGYKSSSGRFQVFYETSGSDAVPSDDANGNGTPDYVEWVAAAADSSWRHMVQTLGFTDPVGGSTNPYPIFVEDLGADGFYGFTSTGSNRGYRNSTYIVINSHLDQPSFIQNDDANPTRGAVNVTVAHELKHAVQYANSQWYGGNEHSPHSLNWSEMDATLMEELLYDDVNDYYNYIRGNGSIFGDDDHTIPVAYSGVTWFLYFAENLGPEFWSDVWKHIKQRHDDERNSDNPNYLSMPEAVEITLTENYDRSYGDAITQSHLWHFASGMYSNTEEFGFRERKHYPTPEINNRLIGQDSIATQRTIAGFSSDYIELNGQRNLAGSAVVTVRDSEPYAGLGLLAYFTDGSTDFKTFGSNENGTIMAKTGWEWERIQKIGIVVTNSRPRQKTNYSLIVSTDIPDKVVLEQNYPNPFLSETTIPVSLPESSNVQIKLFDTVGRLVDTVTDEEYEAGFNPIPLNASGLASGVYLVQVIVDGEAQVKKMTVIK